MNDEFPTPGIAEQESGDQTRGEATAAVGGGSPAGESGQTTHLARLEGDSILGPTRGSASLPPIFNTVKGLVSQARGELPLDSIAIGTLVELFERTHGFVNCSPIAELLISCRTDEDLKLLLYTCGHNDELVFAHLHRHLLPHSPRHGGPSLPRGELDYRV